MIRIFTQEYFSHTGPCEDDIIKGWLVKRGQWDLNPGSPGQQANAKPTELREFLHIDQ